MSGLAPRTSETSLLQLNSKPCRRSEKVIGRSEENIM